MKYSNQFSALCALGLLTTLCCIFVHVNGQDACFQTADPGHCRASIPRFFYDARSGRCSSFIYGGCGGNRNNFVSMGDCSSFRSFCLRRRNF